MATTRIATRSSLSSHVFEIFFLHGGLEFVAADKLLSTLGAVSHEFKRQARREFNSRLTRCHPSLVDAVGLDNIGNIGWKEWCRFELGGPESRERGESMSLTVDDLADIDVLLEVTMDGRGVVWHGCTPLHRGEYCPEADFIVPEFVFDAPKPSAEDLHKFESPSRAFPGLTDYHYWSGRGDVSTNQKTLCKCLYGINSRALIHVHVVLRKRSNGKMLTIISTNEPDAIMGECCGNNIGDYTASYCNHEYLFDDDRRLYAEVCFGVACSEKVDETQQSVQFTTENEAAFKFDFAHTYELEGDEEDRVIRAMCSWKWD